MADISALIREKNRYIELRSNVSSLVNQIGRCIDTLEPTISKMSDYYSIDNIAYDSGSLKVTCEELISKQSNLSNAVLPAINSEISRLNSEIQAAEEELERARREAEARAAAQKEAEAKAAAQKQTVAKTTTIRKVAVSTQTRGSISKINQKVNLLK